MSLPLEIRAEVRAMLKYVFDTYKRQIKLIVETDGVLVSQEDSDYSLSDSERKPSVQTLELEARVWYEGNQKFLESSNIEQVKVEAGQNINRIKIQLEIIHREVLENANKFRFEGNVYVLEGCWRPVGIFETFDYIEAILKREQ